MDGIRGVSLFVFLLVAAGCRHSADVPFPDWLSTVRTAQASSNTGAFEQIAAAALEAEKLAGKDLKRVYFTPQKRTDLIERLSGPMARVSQACRGRIEMPSRAAKPFEALPYQAGWRAIGRAMVWRIERAAALDKTGEAVDWTLAATRFGLALTSGSASDAELGYATIDDARKTLAPAFGKLHASELRKLGTGVEAALGNRPLPDGLIQNERGSMLAAVQKTQDAYRERRLGELLTQLGKDIDPAIDYLDKLRTEDPKERAQYFEDFATEAELWVAHYDQALRRNARQRLNSPGPALKQDRPWRRFARHFFRSIEPLLAVRDECLARTRLLGLNALLLAECKANGAAPGSLTGLSKELTIDPYSGKTLMYRPDGAYFLLYSIGADFKDDGGETNQDGTAPDLRLEEP